MLRGVADDAKGRPGPFAFVDQLEQLAVADRRAFVDDHHGACVEHCLVAAQPGEQQGEGVGFDPGVVAELAGRFAFDGGADDPVSGALPCSRRGAHRRGLARPGPSRGALHPVAAGAPGGDEVALLLAQLDSAVAVEGAVDQRPVDDAVAAASSAAPGADDLVLGPDHLGGGVGPHRPPAVDDGAVAAADHPSAQRRGEGDHLALGEELVGEPFDFDDWEQHLAPLSGLVAD